MLFIPCIPDGRANWTQRTAIEGRDYQLTFDWSQRDGHWSLMLADQDGEPIRAGMSLVTAYPLTRGMRDDRWVGGHLVVLDSQNLGVDPGFADLGSRFLLLHITSDDVVAGT